VSEHWEAAVEAVQGARILPAWFPNNAVSDILYAALPHLRRHIITELREKAEAGRSADDMDDAVMADYAALWLAAQEATDE
jgi:hypothetical protein